MYLFLHFFSRGPIAYIGESFKKSVALPRECFVRFPLDFIPISRLVSYHSYRPSPICILQETTTYIPISCFYLFSLSSPLLHYTYSLSSSNFSTPSSKQQPLTPIVLPFLPFYPSTKPNSPSHRSAACRHHQSCQPTREQSDTTIGCSRFLFRPITFFENSNSNLIIHLQRATPLLPS